jgi:hypothetical protein
MPAMSNAFPPNAWPAPAPSSPAEQAAEALHGWIDAGERIAVLLAPRGAARLDALARLERSLADRFVAERWRADGEGEPDANTVQELRGRRSLVIVADGEALGAEGARALRASLDDPSGARCAVVALAADEAGAVLAGLGPGLEVVVLRDTRKAAAPSPHRAARAVAAAALAAASVALTALVVLPRFGDEPAVPAARSAEPELESEPPPTADVASAPPASAPDPAPAAQVAAPEPRIAAPPAAARAPEPTPPRVAPRTAPIRTAEKLPPRPAATPPRVADAQARPRPADGWLVVNAIPRAEIHVDGAAIGQTPIVRHRLAAGSHRVTARFRDGKADERNIQVAGGELYLMFDGR